MGSFWGPFNNPAWAAAAHMELRFSTRQPEISMLNHSRAQPARLESTCCPGLPPRLSLNSDQGRAPVTFAWWAYTGTGRASKYHHLVTLYRLDRVGANGALVPSHHYGMSADKLRELVRVRHRAALPKLPTGYTWVGPELVEDRPVIAVASLAKITWGYSDRPQMPQELAERLTLARLLAADILRERQPA